MSYNQSLHQVVFCTKFRKPVMIKENRNLLYAYIHGIFSKRKCHVYRIGGIEDHIHILFSLHPLMSLANLVKEVKSGSSNYIRRQNIFPQFIGWQREYGSFTYSRHDKEKMINYVKNQEEHHRKISSQDEYRNLLQENDIPYDEKYLS